ncbi:hypothetical protein [Leifsonia xyli]|uniref:hypothetical protein n=1 Tax=Leifsonia xyli TaxID=1575 RepID=UPI003D6652B8
MVAEEHDDSGRAGGFDPRFDPSFQRGYQPQPGERTRTRVRGEAPDPSYRRPAPALRTAETPMVEPAPFEREASVASVDPIDAVSWAPEEAPALTNAAVVVAQPGILSRLEVSPRRNVLILALWIVGVGFVVLGIVLYCISVTSSYSGPTPSSDVGSLVFAQLGWMLAGPLITVGLLTVVGLLFLNALAGRGARESGSEEGEF